MEITLKAKSSSGNSFYSVNFQVNNGLFSVFCDCPAGEWGKLCKHKWQLLKGDEKMLAEDSQRDQLREISKIARERYINKLYEEVEILETKKRI